MSKNSNLKSEKTIIPFSRYEDCRLSNICIVEFTHKEGLSSHQIMDVFTVAVSDWCDNTEVGNRALCNSGEDINIGDLAYYTDDQLLISTLDAHGLKMVIRDELDFSLEASHDKVLYLSE